MLEHGNYYRTDKTGKRESVALANAPVFYKTGIK